MIDYQLVRELPPRLQQPARRDPAGGHTAAIRPLQDNLEQLVTTPGVWGRVATYPSTKSANSVCSDLRRGKRHRPPGRWQFESGQIPGDLRYGGVWACYIGPEEP